jgi:HK97 family phage major capsid protein
MQNRTTSPKITTRERELDRPYSPAEYVQDLVRASVAPDTTSTHFRALGNNTGVSSEGGFAVPPHVQELLLNDGPAESMLLRGAQELTVSAGSGIDAVVRSRASITSGWVSTTLVAQGATITPEMVKLAQLSLEPNKLVWATYATAELLEDSSIAAIAVQSASDSLRVTLEDGEINGTNGFAGLKNASGRVTIAIEATQTIANTAQFFTTNAAKMLSRHATPHRAIYVMHPDLWVEALTASAGGASNGSANIIGPVTPEAPYGTLHTRPIYPCDLCPAVGTEGDLMLVDPFEYVFAKKGATKGVTSMHARFLNDEGVLRFTTRMTGQPVVSTPITPRTGTNTRSPYVTLATRS